MLLPLLGNGTIAVKSKFDCLRTFLFRHDKIEMKRRTKCDVIRQNESEVDYFPFST